jgi:O-antigen ligase
VAWGGNATHPQRSLFELGLALLFGTLFGALVILSPYLPVSSDFQKLILVVPFAFTLVILFNNLERLILFTVAVGVPLNLDISLVISPYARNLQNLANGRTIVALTELRLGLVFIVVGIGYLLWLVGKPGVQRHRMRLFPRTTFPALALILISTLSILQAQDKQLSLFSIAQMIELFLVYFYIANHLRSKADLQFFTTILMGTVLAESLLMVVQWRTGLSFSIAGINATIDATSHRATGTLGDANTAAVIVSAGLCLACAMFWVFPRRSQKLFTGVCFMAGSVALISTAGRAAWGGFIVAIVTFIFMGWRRGWVSRKALVWLLLLTITIGAIFYPVIVNRLTAYDRGSAVSRIMMSKLALNVIQASPEHFFFGVGANNYALIAPLYVTSDVGDLGHVVDSSVHNVFLLVWSEMGLVGLLIFLWFLFNATLKVWKNFKSNDRFLSLMALGLGSAFLAVCIQMLADPFIARPKTMLLWLLIAMIASLDQMKTKASHYLEKRRGYQP